MKHFLPGALLICFIVLSFTCSRKSTKVVTVETIEPTVVRDQASKDSVEEATTGLVGGDDGPIEEQTNNAEHDKVTKVFLMASIEKTDCYGTCPSFEAQIYSDGRMTYTGKSNVEKIGNFESFVEPGFIPLLLQEAKIRNFFSLSGSYPKNGRFINEIPLTITFVNNGDSQKKVTNNYLSPGSLKSFENFLMALFDSVKWIKKADLK